MAGGVKKLSQTAILFDKNWKEPKSRHIDLLIQDLFPGLKTGLVEKFDFASGTSSRSTKLIHGGVRYLQKAIMGFDLEQVI